MRRNHPLADAVDAGRWDAEAPLGRIVLVAHAAFLHAGFVSHGKPASHRVPRQVGLAASTLPLRYSIPELVRPGRTAADAAVLRLCAHGNFLILYGYLASDGSRPRTRWACVDAPLVAPVLSGGLDAAAGALADDALGARLWKALAGGLARRLFAEICARNAALLPPRLMSLPADLQAAILGRLAGEDLAMVECTCAELRGLVAARELWRAKYMAEHMYMAEMMFGFGLELSEIDGSSKSWKEKYVATRWRWRWRWLLPGSWRRLRLRPLRWLLREDLLAPWELDRCKRQDPTKHLIRRFQQRKSKVPVGDGDVHRRRATAVHGNGQRQREDKAIHSPSARYGWTHR